MRTNRHETKTRGRVPRLAEICCVTFTALWLVGCEGLFEVENPTNLLDEDLERSQLIEALGNSAEANLSGAYSEALVHGEMFGDQIFHPSSQDFAILIDQGYSHVDNVAIEVIYNQLAAARWVADEMVRRLEQLVASPEGHLGVGRSHFWGGVARLALASYFEEVTYDAQAPITPIQAIEDAIERFTAAASVASAAEDRNLEAAAYGAIARAYRSLYYENLHSGAGAEPGLFEQAETFAKRALDTQADFRISTRYGQPGATNGVYEHLVVNLYHRMDPAYAYLRDPASGLLDPRIRHTPLVGRGPRGDSIYFQEKFTDYGDPLPVSRAAEAKLIIAEARLLAGDLVGAVQWMSEVRSASGLPAFQSDSADEIRQQLIYERKTEFWLEGRRWEDHRYYEILPYRWVDVNNVAGVHRRWPVSVQEQNNNPNYSRGRG